MGGPCRLAEFQRFSGAGVKAAKAAVDPLRLEPLDTDCLILPEDRGLFEAFKVPKDPQYFLVGSLDADKHAQGRVVLVLEGGYNLDGLRDVYLVDAQWKRYDPVRTGLEIPLNVLLQPGQSVTTRRHFEVAAASRNIGLMIDRSALLPFCTIIGECGAFHKGTIVRID